MSLALFLPALAPGCGPAVVEYDKAARYTPESLAQELVIRFQALSPTAKISTRKPKVNPAAEKKRIERVDRAALAEKKGGGGPGAKKRKGAPTLDDVIDDIGEKLDRLEGTSRPDACRKMIDTIADDQSLSASDKKTLTDLVGQLALGS